MYRAAKRLEFGSDATSQYNFKALDWLAGRFTGRSPFDLATIPIRRDAAPDGQSVTSVGNKGAHSFSTRSTTKQERHTASVRQISTWRIP